MIHMENTTGLPLVIGITGYATAGKDSIAHHLKDKHGYTHKAFADTLRNLTADVNPIIGTRLQNDQIVVIRYNDALKEHGYTEAKQIYPEIRNVLVGLGNGARNHIQPNVWLDAVLPPQYHTLPTSQRLVVSDVRYPNEAIRIREIGGVLIYVERPGVQPANEHEREHIPKMKPDYTILNNSSLEYLKICVDDLVIRF